MLNASPVSAQTASTRTVRDITGAWAAALVVDLLVFALLNGLAVGAVLANVAATAAGAGVAALMLRPSDGRPPARRAHGLLIVQLVASALLVSPMIALLGHGRPDLELVWKLALTPMVALTGLLARRRAAAAARAAVGGRGAAAWDLIVRHPWASSAGAVLLFFMLVLPMTTAASFTSPTDVYGILREHGTRLVFAGALLALLRWIVAAAERCRLGSPLHRRWLLAASVHAALLIPVLVLLWPGHWVDDEFETMRVATSYLVPSWQGYLTHVYYAFCLYLLPSKVAVVVVQTAFIAIVAGYAHAVLATRLHHRALAWTVSVALLTPAVLLNDFYPLRLTPYAYLLLLVVVHLIRRSWEPAGARVPRPAEFFAIGCAVAVLAFWRSEGVLTLLLLAPAFVLLGMGRLPRRAPAALAASLAGTVLAVALSGWITTSTVNPAYRITTYVSPLSTMLQSDLTGPRIAQDLAAVDRVFDLRVLRSMPSYTETPALWAGALRPDGMQHVAEMQSAFTDIVLHNPGPFLENRWRAVLAANSQTEWVPQVAAGMIDGGDGDRAAKLAAFGASTLFGEQIDPDLKHWGARHLFLLDSRLEPTPATAIVWNAMPPALAVLLMLAAALLRRRWTLALCSAVVLASGLLVFVAEPAAYFMYFFPLYLCGTVGAAAVLARAADSMLARGRAARTPLVPIRPALEHA